MTNAEIANLRPHAQSCHTCRYARMHGQSGECILLGRTLCVGDVQFVHMILDERICDFWSRRPNKWTIFSEKNPHWHDVHYTRAQLQRIQKRRGLSFAE